MYKLVADTIDKGDINALCKWLQTNPRLTKGPLTEQYEDQFAKYVGKKHSVFVNSGSSAILLGLYSLLDSGDIYQGDKIVVPALSWATDFAPIVQLGLTPILVDCNLSDLSLDLDHLEMVFKKHDPQAIILVSVLGFQPNMDYINRLCQKYDVTLLEDCCESLGSEYKNTRLGSFGEMSFFSSYFGHHISTIEGGMICTDSFEKYEELKMLRSHGWSRDLSEPTKQSLKVTHSIESCNENFTFYIPGFNLRSTDLQAFIGIRQLKKLPKIVATRYKNYGYYKTYLSDKLWSPKTNGDVVSNFAYPIIHKDRSKIMEALEGICETRPLIAGSMNKQPMCEKYWTKDTPVADMIHEYGMYLPNHMGMKEKHIKHICSIINKVVS